MTCSTTRYDVSPPVPAAGHFYLVCTDENARQQDEAILLDVNAVARKWCEDRAIPSGIRKTVALLLSDAVRCSTGLRPRELTMTIRWLDLHFLRIELVWRRCAVEAAAFDEAVQSTASGWLADDSGFAAVGLDEASQWFDVDTRGPGAGGAQAADD